MNVFYSVLNLLLVIDALVLFLWVLSLVFVSVAYGICHIINSVADYFGLRGGAS